MAGFIAVLLSPYGTSCFSCHVMIARDQMFRSHAQLSCSCPIHDHHTYRLLFYEVVISCVMLPFAYGTYVCISGAISTYVVFNSRIPRYVTMSEISCHFSRQKSVYYLLLFFFINFEQRFRIAINCRKMSIPPGFNWMYKKHFFAAVATATHVERLGLYCNFIKHCIVNCLIVIFLYTYCDLFFLVSAES